MSSANEARKRVAQVLLAIGALLLLVGVFSGSGLGFFALPMGGMLLAVGTIMFTSVAIIDGVPWLVRLISRSSEPAWDGEIIHTDGGEYKIRYHFDEQGSPIFVVNDVCTAIGTKPPNKLAMQWGGVPLIRDGDYAYFTDADVQTYLIPIAVNNYAAKRLLLIIRNNVLRKLEKQREEKKRYG
jgi:hypothetical protein